MNQAFAGPHAKIIENAMLQEYCAADGVCRDDASCVNDMDCEQPGNDFRREPCDGRATCQNNMCEWACSGPDLCADFITKFAGQ